MHCVCVYILYMHVYLCIVYACVYYIMLILFVYARISYVVNTIYYTHINVCIFIHSASLGDPSGPGVFEPCHGSAPDIGIPLIILYIYVYFQCIPYQYIHYATYNICHLSNSIYLYHMQLDRTKPIPSHKSSQLL